MLLKAVMALLALSVACEGSLVRFSGYCQQGGKVVTINSGLNSGSQKFQQSFPGASLYVYLTGTVTQASLYSDLSSTPLAQPVSCNDTGYFYFYAESGTYDEAFFGVGVAVPFTLGGVNEIDPRSVNGVYNLQQFGAKGDGTTNDTAAIQSALTKVPCGSSLRITKGNYRILGSGPELLLRTCSLQIDADPLAILIPDAGIASSIPVLRLRPLAGIVDKYIINGLQIKPASGISAGHGILIDCANVGGNVSNSVFSSLNIQNVGGSGITTSNGSSNFNGCLYTSTIRESYIGGVGGVAGAYMNQSGDSVRVDHCTFFGDELGILLDSTIGASGFMALDNNSSARKGYIQILAGSNATIFGGDIEAVTASAGTANPAIIYIQGRPGAPVFNVLIDARYIGVVTIPRSIQIDYATGVNLRSILSDIGYGPGVAGSNEMIYITANAANTIIGEGVQFGLSGAPPSRKYLNLSTTTIFPPSVSQDASSIALRDTTGGGQFSSLLTSFGTLGYIQNEVFKSQEFESISWPKSGSSVTVSGTGPDGVVNSARVITEDFSANPHGVQQDTGVPSDAERWWFSPFLKAGMRTWVGLSIQNSTGTKFGTAIFDLITGSVTTTVTFGGPDLTKLIAYSVPMANGWFRCVLSVVSTTYDDVLFVANMSSGPTLASASYTGNGSGNMSIFGASASKTYLSPYFRTNPNQVGPFFGLGVNALDPTGLVYLANPVTVTAPITYNVNAPPTNSAVCYKANGVLGWATNTAGVIGVTCN
jgi:hypothetical protein